MDEFEQLGTTNLDLGVALHSAIGGVSDKTPMQISQIQEISDFFSGYEDGASVLNQIIRSNKNPNIKNIDHLMSYVLLNKKRMSIMDSLKGLEDELKYYA